MHMAQLRQGYDLLQERGAEVLVVGPDSMEDFQHYWKQNQLPFIGVPDESRAVSEMYGQEIIWIKVGRMPALFIIDLEGMIRYAHYGNSMRDILSMDEIYAVLDEINQEAKG
jgi:peroxiredoxin Q/BCP